MGVDGVPNTARDNKLDMPPVNLQYYASLCWPPICGRRGGWQRPLRCAKRSCWHAGWVVL